MSRSAGDVMPIVFFITEPVINEATVARGPLYAGVSLGC